MTSLRLGSIANFREVGGLPTTDGGRMRNGLLYRAGALTRIAPDDAARLGRLRIRTVYDMRSEWEQRDAPDVLPDGARHVSADVIAGMGRAGPGQLRDLLVNPSAAAQLLGDGQGTAMWLEQYRSFVSHQSARRTFGCIFMELASGDALPALLHCATGKDRTGWAVAVLLRLLRVPDDLVMRDYLASRRRLKPFLAPALADWERRGGDPRLLRPIIATRRAYLEAAWCELEARFGTLERYFSEGMGVDAGAQERLREVFVEHAA